MGDEHRFYNKEFFINYCKISQKTIDFVYDNNPLKQGKYLPGSRIKILRPHLFETSRTILPSCPPPNIPIVLFSVNISQK